MQRNLVLDIARAGLTREGEWYLKCIDSYVSMHELYNSKCVCLLRLNGVADALHSCSVCCAFALHARCDRCDTSAMEDVFLCYIFVT